MGLSDGGGGGGAYPRVVKTVNGEGGLSAEGAYRPDFTVCHMHYQWSLILHCSNANWYLGFVING